MATLRDVAKAAGTSPAAVSAVLNGKLGNIRVSDATRERICSTAAALGYVANPIARSLVTGKTGLISLILPYPRAFIDQNPFCLQIISGVFEELLRTGSNMMLNTSAGENWYSVDPHTLMDRRADGLLLILPPQGSAIIPACQEEEFPYVAICHPQDDKGTLTINSDDVMGGIQATEYLLQLGHRRIAHFGGDWPAYIATAKEQGYREALQRWGIPINEDWVFSTGFDWKPAYKAAEQLFAMPKSERPTAVFAANDLCANGIFRWMSEHGLSVPEDLSVIGFDDTWFARFTHPPLTTIHMPLYWMGVKAVRMLLNQIHGLPIANPQPVFPTTLTIRQSCREAAP